MDNYVTFKLNETFLCFNFNIQSEVFLLSYSKLILTCMKNHSGALL